MQNDIYNFRKTGGRDGVLAGFRGMILRVDLTNGKVSKEHLNEKFARKFFGGRCLGAKILFDELAPRIDPLGPKNKIVFAVGPIVGAPFIGNSRYVVMAKSPLTGVWGESNSAGFFGPELKFAGYDAVIIEGRAEVPVYLWINNDDVEIRGASHFWGKTTGDTISSILNEVGDDKTRVACIGMAGEKLVKYACVVSDFHHVAGRTGMGAVMGSKNLKAVGVRGTKKIEIADEKEFFKLAKRIHDEVWDRGGKLMYLHGTTGYLDETDASGRLPTKAFLKCRFEAADKITGEVLTNTMMTKRVTCYACDQRCDRLVRAQEPYIVDEKYGHPEYETAAAFGSLCMNSDIVSIAKANELCNKYGLDTISTGVCIAFAMECFEHGILTENTGGLDLSWGNSDSIVKLVEKIALREEYIGDLLAEGVRTAAKELGREAEKYALHVKGMELPMHEPRGKKGLAISYAVSNRGACHLQATHDDSFEIEDNMLPELGITRPIDRLDMSEQKAKYVKVAEDIKALEDSLVLCENAGWPAFTQIRNLVGIVNAVTGWDLTFGEMVSVGERAFNLCRAFNVREGITRSDDSIPPRLMEPLTEGPYKGQAIESKVFEEMMNKYYEYRGWDAGSGFPTARKLDELGLDWVRLELQSMRYI